MIDLMTTTTAALGQVLASEQALAWALRVATAFEFSSAGALVVDKKLKINEYNKIT